MTTIAWRDGILAGDGACNHLGTRVGYRDKVRRISLPDGKTLRIGLTGAMGNCEAVAKWLERGRKGDIPADYGENAGAVVCFPDDDEAPTLIEFGYETPLPIAQYHAWGSGRDIALGAMWAGADAKQAISAAIAHDLHTGGQITALGRRG